MKEDAELAECLPETRILSDVSFWELLNKYGAVVIKPSKGAQGYGVLQVSKHRGDRYAIHDANHMITYDLNGLKEYLDKDKFRRKLYLVQQCIPLAQVEGRPFDVRVMVERQGDTSAWHVTKSAVKVATKGYFITNMAADILTLGGALERSNLLDIDVSGLSTKIDRIALLTADKLGEYYPSSKVMGLDIGITDTGSLYIIEANLKPSMAMFKRLKDE